jgi:hypothetical protein
MSASCRLPSSVDLRTLDRYARSPRKRKWLSKPDYRLYFNSHPGDRKFAYANEHNERHQCNG